MSMLASLRMRTAEFIQLGWKLYHDDLVVSTFRHITVAYSVSGREIRL